MSHLQMFGKIWCWDQQGNRCTEVLLTVGLMLQTCLWFSNQASFVVQVLEISEKTVFNPCFSTFSQLYHFFLLDAHVLAGHLLCSTTALPVLRQTSASGAGWAAIWAKPWRWLSCFECVSGDSLTKEVCAVGPKPEWSANKEPTALTNRLFGRVLFSHPLNCLLLIKHNQADLISFPWQQRAEIVVLDLTSVISFYFPQQVMTWNEKAVRSACRDRRIWCWFCLKFSPIGCGQLLQSQNIYFRALQRQQNP